MSVPPIAHWPCGRKEISHGDIQTWWKPYRMRIKCEREKLTVQLPVPFR